MRLTIFAATGRIGALATEQAIAAGHEVTAVARNTGPLPAAAHRVRADLMTADADALRPALTGADAVLSCLGARTSADSGVTSRGTAAIAAAMHAACVRRLLVISAAPISTFPSPAQRPKRDPGEGFVVRHLLTPVLCRVFRDAYTDLAAMEDMLAGSDLDWTVLRPPRLTNGRRSGTYRSAIGQNLRGGRSISRADVADAMLALIDRPETIRRAVGVAR